MNFPGRHLSGDILHRYLDYIGDIWRMKRLGVTRYQLGTAHSFYDADGTTARFQIFDDGNVAISDQNGTTMFRWNESGNRFDMGTTNTGLQEVFPRGTLITQGTASSATDITNVPSSMTKLTDTVQTIACDYNNQPVFVKVMGVVVWKNIAADTNYVLNAGINGSNYGQNQALRNQYTSTSASGDNEDIDGSSGSASWDTATPDLSGTSGAQSAGTAHTHSAGTYNTPISELTHTHTSGSFAVNGTHTHNALPVNHQTTCFYWTSVSDGITANGSGDVEISLYALGDDTADIEGWSVAWEILRR